METNCTIPTAQIDITEMDPREMDGIEYADTFAGKVLLTNGPALRSALTAAGIKNIGTFTAWAEHHFVARQTHNDEDGDRDFVIHLPSGRTMDFRYWAPGNRGGEDRNYGTVGTMMSREDIIAYSDALASLVALMDRD